MNSENKKIKDHYETSKTYSIDNRELLETINIRKMNNFIKSILINKYVKPNDSVLDLGCGKGGDLKKFQNCRVKKYFGLDFTENSIKEAINRAKKIRLSFKYVFEVCDVLTKPLDLNERFDIVSLQFVMHYAFESDEILKNTLKNISKHLNKGGSVLITLPNPEAIIRRYEKYGNNFGNNFYSIKFDSFNPQVINCGIKYFFYLKDSIEECQEYLVDLNALNNILDELDLIIVYKKDFVSFFNENIKEFKGLYEKMGKFILNEDELAVPQLYMVIVVQNK